jgi:hypothetical protein
VRRPSVGVAALLRAGDVRTLLTRYADLALAAVVVAIVGMMIVPLPTPLLDLLISVNIAAAVTLLLVAIYVSDALKIATFPPSCSSPRCFGWPWRSRPHVSSSYAPTRARSSAPSATSWWPATWWWGGSSSSSSP